MNELREILDDQYLKQCDLISEWKDGFEKSIREWVKGKVLKKKEYPPISQQSFNDHPDQWKNDVAYATYCSGYNKAINEILELL